MKGKELALRAIPALLAAAFAGHAGASGFQLLEQNASGLGNSYAGSAAVADNASTIYFNPAGMTQLQAREVSLGINAVKPSFKFNNGNSATGGLSGDGGDGGDWAFVPNAYLSWALNKDLYVGLGIGAPFGLVTEYENPWVGAAHSRKFEIKTININPSIAYRVNDKVSLGVGLNWQKLEAEYIRTVGIASAGLRGSTATMELDDSAWGWNIGALFNVSPTTKVGVSYRSAIEYKATGNVKVTGPSPALNAAGTSDVKADIEFPDTVVLSATQDLSDRWQLLGDLSWTGWSSIPKVDIYRTSGAGDGTIAQTLETKFRDTWRVALGANYKLDDAWKLKFGIAYDQSPVHNADDRLTALPDNNRFWFSTGAQWKPNKAATVDLGLAYLYIKDTDINNDQRSANPLLNRGLVNGTYDSSIWILGAQYSMAF
ncbi:MAG: outer membrane protein transport protein [Rhodocyclaceae bacterium]